MQINKRGQAESFLIAIISLAIIGLIFFFVANLRNELYDGFDNYFNSSEDFNESVARQSLNTIQDAENNLWDWAFLAIFIGYVIQILLLSFAARINLGFFWILVVVDIIVLIVGVVLSNIWQATVASPALADTLQFFPVTNSLLGTYYPMAIVAILFIGMVITFGKSQQERQ